MKYQEEKEFIIGLIHEAHNKFLNKDRDIEEKSTFDLVTNIDKDIEDFIRIKINEKYPNDSFYGEESEHNYKEDVRTWVLDPIDGTFNFAYNNYLFATQCALIDNNELVLSVIIVPKVNECFYAIKGYGAYLNDKRIFVQKPNDLKKAICTMGDLKQSDKELLDSQTNLMNNLINSVAKIRMIGSAAIDFSNLACGRSHGYIVLTRNLWDLLPGILMVKEAGGIVKNYNGEEYKYNDLGVICASSKEIYDLIINSKEQK